MFASDYTPLANLFIGAIIALVVVPVGGAFLSVALINRWPGVSLVFGLVACLAGGTMLLLTALSESDAPLIVWAILSIPLICGIVCLSVWKKQKV